MPKHPCVKLSPGSLVFRVCYDYHENTHRGVYVATAKHRVNELVTVEEENFTVTKRKNTIDSASGRMIAPKHEQWYKVAYSQTRTRPSDYHPLDSLSISLLPPAKLTPDTISVCTLHTDQWKKILPAATGLNPFARHTFVFQINKRERDNYVIFFPRRN